MGHGLLVYKPLCPTSAPDSAPEGLVIVSFNASTLGATWERPPDQTINGMLRHYIIEYCKVDEMPESECKVANVSGDTTRILLTDLEEQQAYNVSVAAYTIGPGPFASVVTTAGQPKHKPGLISQTLQSD